MHMSKSFIEYLAESKRTYNFKVGLAGMLADDTGDRLESLMQKYSVVKMSNGKKTPIQKKALDFPALENIEVTYFDIEVEYPTTTSVLEEYLKHSLGLAENHIVVRKPGDPLIAQQEEPKAGDGKANLESEYPKADPKAQKTAGDSRVMELLKELEKVRKDREAPDASKDVKTNPEGDKGIMEK
tara:strand:- start:24486 stop:25037 length:552 start_codon:yes stop_codon:yes gene_type:complete